MHLAPAILAGLAPAALLAATPAALADGLFPDESDIRQQKISRQAGEQDWPFAAGEGSLLCMPTFGMKVVIFVPEPAIELDETAAREVYARNNYVMVSTDPLQLWLDAGKSHLFTADLKIEDKIRRLAPFVTLGKKLCDQPKWTNLGPSEL
jgi:hypothetical protein